MAETETETETEKLRCRIGLYNKAFQMASVTVEEEIRVEPDRNIAYRNRRNSLRWPANFTIQMGPMDFNDHVYTDTFVLEIHYQGSNDAHRDRLGAFSFGSHLYADFAEVAHQLFWDFCQKHGLSFSNHLNSWPKFQAIVFKKPQSVCRSEEPE